MGKSELIHKTIQALEKLPPEKIGQVTDFAEYLLSKLDEEALQKGIQQLVADSDTFHFLEEEPEVYSVKDLKEKYK